MTFRVLQNFLQHRKAIAAVVALLIAGLAASYYWMEQKDWLGRVTLEVQATSAPGMGRAAPTRGALLLQSATAEKNVLQAKDWTGATAKPFSRLRFEIPRASYQQIIFFPDPSLQEVEIVRLRLIPHSEGSSTTEISLDRVRNQQASVTCNRTTESIRFQRASGTNIMAITLDVADLLTELPPARSPRFLETILVFLVAFLTAYLCAL